MPYYEYFCQDTNTIYTFFARSLSIAGKSPRCPHCESFHMVKQLSNFAITGRAKEPSEGGVPDLDDPRSEKMLASLEKEFAGFNEDHPDPRQLGRLMRRMSELTGNPLPGDMEEMTRRLELGEDPEKLEEQFGDGGDGGDCDDAGCMEGAGPQEGPVRRAWRQLRARPRKDPKIYELADYL